MRQPMEDGVATIARARETLSCPAKFMLIVASTPCPCGYYGDATRPCSCAEATVTRYQKRLSGPILDRIDMHLTIPRVEFEKLTGAEPGESSTAVREPTRPERARLPSCPPRRADHRRPRRRRPHRAHAHCRSDPVPTSRQCAVTDAIDPSIGRL